MRVLVGRRRGRRGVGLVMRERRAECLVLRLSFLVEGMVGVGGG